MLFTLPKAWVNACTTSSPPSLLPRPTAVGLGNSEGGEDVVQALTQALGRVNNMVDEHIEWALSQLTSP